MVNLIVSIIEKVMMRMRCLNILAVIALFISCVEKPDSKKIMLKNFYTEYIQESSKINPNFSKLDSLKLYYCTTKLLEEIKGFDYDPFLNSQDCSLDYLNKMEFNKDTVNDDLYYVSYYSFNEIKKVISINFLENDTILKIDSLNSLP